MFDKFKFFVLSVCCTFSALAEDVDLFDLSLKELLNVKVTIASLSEQTTFETPSSVTVYTREDIRRMGRC